MGGRLGGVFPFPTRSSFFISSFIISEPSLNEVTSSISLFVVVFFAVYSNGLFIYVHSNCVYY